jgi:hypothetical protein
MATLRVVAGLREALAPVSKAGFLHSLPCSIAANSGGGFIAGQLHFQGAYSMLLAGFQTLADH